MLHTLGRAKILSENNSVRFELITMHRVRRQWRSAAFSGTLQGQDYWRQGSACGYLRDPDCCCMHGVLSEMAQRVDRALAGVFSSSKEADC
jgi:hypothetical protein